MCCAIFPEVHLLGKRRAELEEVVRRTAVLLGPIFAPATPHHVCKHETGNKLG